MPYFEWKKTSESLLKMVLKKNKRSQSDVGTPEEYYNMLKEMYEFATNESGSEELFEGTIGKDDEAKRDEFVSKKCIGSISQALIEYLILLERDVQKKKPPVSQTAIYNAVLRLEKTLTTSSFWDLVDMDVEDNDFVDSVPLTTFTDFEFNLLELTISAYIVTKLEGNADQVLFFPLMNPPDADALVTWRILEKIVTVSLIPSAIYKQKLKEHLKIRLKKEVEKWLKDQLKDLRMDGYRAALTSVKELTKILMNINKELTSSINHIGLVQLLFSASNCNYCDVTAEALETELVDVCVESMNLLDAYNEAHKEFHVNMRESSMLCHVFYLQLKQIEKLLSSNTKTYVPEKWIKLYSLFNSAFLHLLHVVKVECHSRIHRAVQSEERDTIIEEHGISSSTVIVLNCLSTVLEEYKQLKIEEEDMKVTFVIKISEVLCDACKIFTESMQNRAINAPKGTKDPIILRKICVAVNNVQHLKDYISELPALMQWQASLKSLGEDHAPNNLKNELSRILNLIFESTLSHFDNTVEDIFQLLATHIRNQCERFLNSWVKDQIVLDPRLQNVERLLAVLHDQVEVVQKTLKSGIFLKFLKTLWFNILTYVSNEFQEGKIPDYAKTIKKNIEEIHKYFTTFKTEEFQESDLLWENLLTSLEINSKTTMELQLSYYGQLADSLASPVEYLGHIAFQAGYKTSGKGTIDLTVKVQKAQKLPVRTLHIDDVKVKVKFSPEVLFPSIKPKETKLITEELQNPVFDETFNFYKLPLSALSIEGAVVHLLVQNENGSFASEAVLRLNLIQDMNGFTSISFLPVYLMPLKRPDRTLPFFKILEKRKKRDRGARHFVSSQIATENKHAVFLNCMSRTNSFRRFLSPIKKLSK